MAAECPKSTKSADLQLSRIQALFLDAVRPLSGLIDGINKGIEVTVDNMYGRCSKGYFDLPGECLLPVYLIEESGYTGGV